MTFCLGTIVKEGIIGIADSRLTSGNEIISAKKVSVYQQGHGSLFVMTSGLRSVRDKTLTYFEEAMAERPEPCDRLYKAINLLAEQENTEMLRLLRLLCQKSGIKPQDLGATVMLCEETKAENLIQQIEKKPNAS